MQVFRLRLLPLEQDVSSCVLLRGQGGALDRGWIHATGCALQAQVTPSIRSLAAFCIATCTWQTTPCPSLPTSLPPFLLHQLADEGFAYDYRTANRRRSAERNLNRQSTASIRPCLVEFIIFERGRYSDLEIITHLHTLAQS